MNYELDIAIEQLQKSLEKVNSAREQVEIVSASYAGLEKAVKGFTENLSSISVALSSVTDSIHSARGKLQIDFEATLNELVKTSNSLLTNFAGVCDSISDGFLQQTDSTFDELKKEIDNFHNDLNKLETLSESIETSVKKIGTVCKGVDGSLLTLKTAQEDVLNQLSKNATTVFNNLKDLQGSISLVLNFVPQAEKRIKQEVIKSQNTISEQLINGIEELKKQQSQNRNLIIVTIVIAIVSLIVSLIK